MSFALIPGGPLWIPNHYYPSTSVPGFTASTIDASTDRIAAVLRAPQDMIVDQALCGISSITTSANLDIRIETVGTTGAATPTGTLWATNTAVTGLVPAAQQTIRGSLTASATILRGQLFAVVIQETSGGGAINLAINRFDLLDSEFPYGSSNLTGAYANGTPIPLIGLRDATTGKWVYLSERILPIQANATPSISTSTGASTGTRRGARFQLPFSGTLGWSRWRLGPATTTGDFTINIYTDGGTLLQTLATLDANQRRASGGVGSWEIPHDTDCDLIGGTWYRLVIVPTTANGVSVVEMQANVAAHLDGMPLGQNFHSCKFVSSAWVDVTSDRPWMSLGLTAIDSGHVARRSIVRRSRRGVRR